MEAAHPTKVIASREFGSVKCSLGITNDSMKLFISSEGAGDLAFEAVRAWVIESCPQANIDDTVLQSFTSETSPESRAKPRRIAKGQESVPGRDGRLVFMVKRMTVKQEASEDTGGKRDLHNIHLFDNIVKGAVVARLYPPLPGKDGTDALGNKLAATAGKPLKVDLDKTLLLQPAKTEGSFTFQPIVAEETGLLLEEGSKLLISDTLTIKGDLDLHYGNIDFVGKVVIKGDVHHGFKVQAHKGIDIMGSARGARLVAKDGAITIKGICVGGREGGYIEAQNLLVRGLSEYEVHVMGEVQIEKEAIDSKIFCGGWVSGAKAWLIGGMTATSCGVEVAALGNDKGQKTVVELSPDLPTAKHIMSLEHKIHNDKVALETIQLHLGPFLKKEDHFNQLPPDKRAKLQALLHKCKVLAGNITLMNTEIKQLREKAAISDDARVSFIKHCFVDVEIRRGTAHWACTQQLVGPQTIGYIVEKKEIGLKPFLARPAVEKKDEQPAKRK